MKKYPLFSALDIGSNAIRMLFANIFDLKDKIIVYKNSLVRIPIRLGEDVYNFGEISDKKIKQLIQTIKVFKGLNKLYQPYDTEIIATAALREATNSHVVLEKVKRKTNREIKIIDGLEEARIIKELYEYSGRVADTNLFADLGGGSLELTILNEDKSFVSKSFKIGAVRYLNKPIPQTQINEITNWLHQNLPRNKSIRFIGTGGNINTVKKTFTSPNIPYITLSELKDILHKLSQLSIDERITTYMLRQDRADIIVPAIQIFILLMEEIKINEVYVSGGGLVDGVILQLYLKNRATLLKQQN